MKPEMMFALRQEAKRAADGKVLLCNTAAHENQPAGMEQKESAPAETKVIYPAETKRIRKPKAKAKRKPAQRKKVKHG